MNKYSLFLVVLFLAGLASAEWITLSLTNSSVIFASGAVANGANVSVYNQSMASGGGESSLVLINSTLVNSSGKFILGFEQTTTNGLSYKLKITYNTSDENRTHMSAFMPPFPLTELNQTLATLNHVGVNLTLQNITQLKVNATNAPVGFSQNFGYMLKDLSSGMMISDNSNTSNLTEYLFLNKNYSLTVWQQYNVTGNNEPGANSRDVMIYAVNLTQNIDGNNSFYYSVNLSTQTLTISGNLSCVDNGSAVNYSGILVLPMSAGEAAYGSRAQLWNPITNPMITGDGSFINVTRGNFSFNVSSSTSGISYLVFATGNDSLGNYYGGFQNITARTGQPFSLNITLKKLLGNSSLNYTGYQNDIFGTRFAVNINKTGEMLSTGGNVVTKFSMVTYNNGSQVNFSLVVFGNNSGTLVFPFVNGSSASSQMFMQGYAPRKFDINASDITAGTKTVAISQMGVKQFENDSTIPNVAFNFYISNSTCDIPEPPASCLLTNFNMEFHENGTADDNWFHPLGFVLAGLNISLSIQDISSGVTVKVNNVDLFASGPPDFEKGSSTTTSSGSFEKATRIGSAAPKVFDSAYVSFGYDSTLDENQGVYALFRTLYYDNGTEAYNYTMNGTSVPSYFEDYNTTLLNGSANGGKGLLCAADSTATCYVNTTSNKVWIKVPHFSSSSASVLGTAVSSSSSYTSSSSSSKRYVDAVTSFDCKSGELNVTGLDGISEGKIGLVDESPPYHDLVITPISANMVTFTVLSSGTYSLVAYNFPSSVSLNDFKKTFTLCSEETTGSAIETNESATVTEADNSTVEQPEAVPEPTVSDAKEKEDATIAISTATASISTAKTENKDVSSAQAKLAEANVVLATGDYAQAKALAEEAFELAKNAKAAAVTPVKTQETVKQATAKPQDFDLGILLIPLAIIVALALAYFFLLNKKSKGYKKV